jgi:hypothetical protein
MRLLKLLAVSLLVLIFSSAYAQRPSSESPNQIEIDGEHRKWIDQVLQSIATIKQGMTRKNLSNVFEEEGGLSTRTQRKYVYKDCPYIKVDVEFSAVEAAVDGNANRHDESPDDKIVKISRPYLEYSISD